MKTGFIDDLRNCKQCGSLEHENDLRDDLCPNCYYDVGRFKEEREKTFILYSLLYQELEKQDIENVASRIDYLTGKDYSDICELYKIAKNLKQHDRELVKEVCGKIKEQLGFIVDGQERISCDGSATGDKTILAVLDQIQKEFEDGK